MIRPFKSLVGAVGPRGLGLIFATAVAAALPTSAMAGRYGDDRSRDRDRDVRDYRDSDRHDRGRVDVDFRRDSAPAPSCETTEVWVEPVYRTVYERVWVEAVVRRDCERVWVPDRYEVRDVVRREGRHDVIRREQVLVERGHYADVARDVVVTPGHFADVPRQELVCAGHFERVERVAVAPPRREEGLRFDLRLPFRW
jgi:hypothetical protein